MTPPPFLAPLPHLTRPLGADRDYRTVGALRHRDGDVVDSGYRTDLASIPRAFHWLLPPASPYEAAAVRHDKRCNDLNDGTCDVDSRTADRDFRQDLRSLGMGPIRAWMMWLGVRLGALVSATRRPGITPDLPLMALLLILNLWVAIPTAICTAAVTILDWIEPTPRASAHLPDVVLHDERDLLLAA